MSVEIDKDYLADIAKQEAAEKSAATPEEIDVPEATMSEAVELLRTLKKQEMLKTVSYKPGEEAWPKVTEINQMLKELESGKIETAKKFLEQKAKQAAEKYNISANTLEELSDRLAEARVGLEEDIRTATEELSGAKAEFEAVKGDIDQSQVVAIKVMAAERKLNDLLVKQKENFQDVQQFINASESLGE